jgi:hypothetical protein
VPGHPLPVQSTLPADTRPDNFSGDEYVINELMYMNWQEMIKPERSKSPVSPTYGKFVCEPLERGFGITIGNALRRVSCRPFTAPPSCRSNSMR